MITTEEVKRGYLKIYDEKGRLISKSLYVPKATAIIDSPEEETLVLEESDEITPSRD